METSQAIEIINQISRNLRKTKLQDNLEFQQILNWKFPDWYIQDTIKDIKTEKKSYIKVLKENLLNKYLIQILDII